MDSDFEVSINEIKKDASGIKDVYTVNFHINEKPDFGSVFVKIHAPREADIIPLARLRLEEFADALYRHFKNPPKG